MFVYRLTADFWFFFSCCWFFFFQPRAVNHIEINNRGDGRRALPGVKKQVNFDLSPKRNVYGVCIHGGGYPIVPEEYLERRKKHVSARQRQFFISYLNGPTIGAPEIYRRKSPPRSYNNNATTAIDIRHRGTKIPFFYTPSLCWTNYCIHYVP